MVDETEADDLAAKLNERALDDAETWLRRDAVGIPQDHDAGEVISTLAERLRRTRDVLNELLGIQPRGRDQTDLRIIAAIQAAPQSLKSLCKMFRAERISMPHKEMAKRLRTLLVAGEIVQRRGLGRGGPRWIVRTKRDSDSVSTACPDAARG